MTTNKYVELETVTLELRDYLAAWGIDLPFELKRRDPEEPGRERKEKMEDKLYAATMRHFRWQKKKLREILETYYPDRKTIDVYGPPPAIWEQLFLSIGWQADLLKLLTEASQDGILLFSELVELQIDYTLVNVEAAEWARLYAGDLIKVIEETTKTAIQQAVSTFVETPGFTLGDAMEPLINTFGESRAMTIASTEITNAYGKAEQLAGEQMQEDYPDIPIIKTWFTSSDDRVCFICGPLHNVSVLVGDNFIGGDGAEYDSPAAHPRCRCAMSTRSDPTGEILGERVPMEKPEEWENPNA